MNKIIFILVAITFFFPLDGFSKKRRHTVTQKDDRMVQQSYSLKGISKVIFRSELASFAQVKINKNPDKILVSADPAGGAKGYHPPDDNWSETPAKDWGLNFKSKQYANILVISSFNEIFHLHHHYFLEKISIEIPAGIELIKIDRKLTGEGSADLELLESKP